MPEDDPKTLDPNTLSNLARKYFEKLRVSV